MLQKRILLTVMAAMATGAS
jgi:hypothetical protein